jgi:hypothetical protein
MSDDGGDKPLESALQRAQKTVHDRGEDVPTDLEPVLRSALARSGLTWELLGHRLEHGDPPTLYAKFRLAHPASGDEQEKEFPIPLSSDEPTATTIQNALEVLWSHSLREVLSVSSPGSNDPTSHLQPTQKIPKIEE